ncbi:hypothetical protein [Mucilaginibacter celer]|uniref:Uncharacterized protein n=1 Tax=Mucilaginibacter celer TaxID=2305508 RepID=A0A494VS81_9SPHI|nr:hypothetical protein [Mucilaginibacter celer]AYL96260.1 hypothetical protein HYN43_013580 [Mucilaginibacter celer]
MKIVTFKYSKSLWVFGIVVPSFMTVFCVLRLKKDNWPEILPIITALVFVIISFCKRCFTYDLRDKIALQLDDEKLTSFIDGKVIYWHDVTGISYQRIRWGIRICFKVNRHDIFEETVCIATTHIEGNDFVIYNAINQFIKL